MDSEEEIEIPKLINEEEFENETVDSSEDTEPCNDVDINDHTIHWEEADVLGFPGYMVSETAIVYSLKSGITMKQRKNGCGYLVVDFCHNGKRKIFYIHKLVALLHLPNPEDKKTVDHIDRNKENNHISNLRWADCIEQRKNRDNPKHQRETVLKYDLENSFLATYKSITEAVTMNEKLKISRRTMKKYCTGPEHKYKGFIWKFDTEKYQDEIWRKVPLKYLEGVEVSNYARVRRGNKIFYGHRKRDYVSVGLKCKDGKSRSFLVHRLIMYAFVGIREDMEVNHKDRNTKNNHLGNLEYVTKSENIQHAYKTGHKLTGKLGPKSRVVECFSPDGELIFVYLCMEAAAELQNVNRSTIRKQCNEKYKYFGELFWKYPETKISEVKLINRGNRRIVEKIDKDGKFLKRYESTTKAAAANKLDAKMISDVCKGERDNAKGTYWRYCVK